jgi:photosystem II stability/assembly factor-like uncharacterized protein
MRCAGSADASRRAALLVAVAIAGPLSPALAAEWAEPMPLATSSLLLDAASNKTRIVAVGERGHVLVSDDRGVSWQQVVVPTRSTLTAVELVADGQAWTVGHQGLILHSADRGLSWQVQRASTGSDDALLDVWFANPRRGVAVGAYGELLSTDDGGKSWRSRGDDPQGPHFNAIGAAPDDSLYTAGEFGVILRSDDRGLSWRSLASPYDGSLFGVLALDDGAVLVYGLRGHLFRSTDRGASWREVPTGTTATLFAGLQRAGGEIVVAGAEGVLLRSEDRGRSFRLERRADRRTIAALVELGPDRLLAVGEGGLMAIEGR